jgi:hypothetical protein
MVDLIAATNVFSSHIGFASRKDAISVALIDIDISKVACDIDFDRLPFPDCKIS